MMIEEILSIGIFVYFLLDFIDSIGKNYNILDIPILLALFQCLLMPIVVFHVYNDDALVIALKYDMGVSAETYYSFMFPAVVAMAIGMKLPPLLQPSYQQKFLHAVVTVRKHLEGKGNLGVLLILIGFVTTIMKSFISGQLQYIAYLFSLLLYVGVLYTFFSDHKQRFLYLIGGTVVIVGQAIGLGMFGELVYIMLLVFLLVMLGRKVSSPLKFGLAITGFFFILLLQSVKADYRAIAWRGQGKGDQTNTGAFFTLILERLAEPGRFFDIDLMFPTVNRFNQGMIVGKVLDHVPKREPFAEGETIFKSLAATFVPRVLWPDKPESGGHQNMLRFTGFKIEGYSMNISPMGEAYGNYGVEGGIFFMLLYGLFFAFLIVLLMGYVKKKPTLILWFPILFLNSVQIETDILMCLNSLIKNMFFVAFCYWAADRFLRLKL
ncbi:hypothetical protein [Lacibacter sp. H407]|uniref:hypothetical protein n=1 Tax=Lacibacter sp. H407 TaxID=3133423 RepID=UPI0030BAEEB3